MRTHLLALDQGTTSSRALLLDQAGNVTAVAQREFEQIFPQAGWVEHNPVEIWSTQVGVVAEVISRSGIKAQDIAAIGITNQRETAIVWDRTTGEPVYNAIVWQDRRTAGLCDKLKRDGFEELVQEKTGLVIDPYFSGSKVAWILDNVAGARQKAERGELAFGTVDSRLVWKLTEGAVHVTDETNASRTMLFNPNPGLGRSAIETARCAEVDVAVSEEFERGLWRVCRSACRGPDRRHCRRSAIGSVRADVPSSRDGQEYVWDRLLHADEYGEEPDALSQ